MMTFWILAFALSVVAAAFVLLPMRRFRERSQLDRTSINVAIFQEKLEALEESRDAGELTGEEFTTLKRELEQSLLTDVGEPERAQRLESTVSQPAVALVSVAIPFVAFLLYAELGSIQDVEIARKLGPATTSVPHDTANPASMGDAVESLYKRLQDQPDNHEGWFLLARSLAMQGSFERASAAFGHLLESFPEDVDLLSYQAESLYMADRQTLTPRVRAVVAKGLAIDPSAASMLQILGLDAYQAGRSEEALSYFNRVLAQPDIGDDRREFLTGLVNEAGGTVAAVPMQRPAPAAPTASPPAGGSGQKAINVMVELAAGVKVSPGDTVFVFARAVGGPPMPLAAKRMSVSDLPVTVRLDESMAMNPAFSLATASEVQVVARITRGGGVKAEAGDWEAVSENLTLGDSTPVVKLRIAQQVGG